MSTKMVLMILALLVPMLQASGQVIDGKSGNGPVNININLPGHNMGGGDTSCASQEALIAELKKHNADLQRQLRNVTTELWLHKKACISKSASGVLSVSSGVFTSVLSCPRGYYVQFQNRCFKFSSEFKNYTDAKSVCEADDGHLVMPKDKATNDFLVEQFQIQNPVLWKFQVVIWIGLTDQVQHGVLMWEDGTPLAGWSNWHNRQPSHMFNPGVDCTVLSVNIYHVGKWTAASCNIKANYVCEVSATISP
ncbi:PREDICTED: low affinity immunoglobulin epsilon Fc receptor-like [Branchiostoma belcheri]|uniref:Low affinity immunoglobulin epsilon Fc receptor-like n=1 Tax=Branchiostoma belcheri TaxID=7741 RepID=A0A6P4ZVP1_BRABE|nr:PREDICTED: low affinity immunoglobulin epsilon Fc receptor-like [Branchiostoma belcheri]